MRYFRGFVDNLLVVGAIQRDGEIRLQVVPTNNRKNLHDFIRKHTRPDTEMIITDDHPAYHGIGDKDTDHLTVNHRLEEWVRGKIHTNSIENVWSLFKRSIVGSYRKISAKHLESYLDELEWRFNNRDNPFLFRDTLKNMITTENLEYQELIAS